MTHVETNEPSFGTLLMQWIRYHLAQRMLAMRPKIKASDAAAAVATRGNPSGF